MRAAWLIQYARPAIIAIGGLGDSCLSPCSGGGGGEIWGCERSSDSASDSDCSQAGGGYACSGAMGFQSTQGESLLERTGSGRARWGVAGDRVLN